MSVAARIPELAPTLHNRTSWHQVLGVADIRSEFGVLLAVDFLLERLKALTNLLVDLLIVYALDTALRRTKVTPDQEAAAERERATTMDPGGFFSADR